MVFVYLQTSILFQEPYYVELSCALSLCKIVRMSICQLQVPSLAKGGFPLCRVQHAGDWRVPEAL